MILARSFDRTTSQEARMDASRRHHAILMAVRAAGSVRAAELATRLGVSAITVRRDLAELEERGDVTRVHGGAVLPGAVQDAVVAPALRRPTGHRAAIGMVVPAASQYFREVVEGARRAAQARDTKLVLAVSDGHLDDDRSPVRRLLEARVDGLLLTPGEPGSRPVPALEWLAELPVPVLFVERSCAPTAHLPPVEYVASDHRHGAIQAVRHLAELGHRDVALITGRSPASGWITRGYDAAVAALGLSPAMPRHEDHAHEEIARRLDDFLDGFARHGVTAVLAHPDSIAIQVLRRARQRGLVVPDDLSVIAYDDEFAGLADIPLTAVAPPRENVGRLAVEFLLRKLHSGRKDRAELHIHLLPHVVVRASTAAPRAAVRVV
ncbi:substrate-binding domain-containing protein [Actinosynnema sp. NPDC023587]|uniref:substrate-binding domain-containing protein n=1 Tax=Actinosynnema sp. NPDC023587 TaxID=3154695 RepID=UPI003402F373